MPKVRSRATNTSETDLVSFSVSQDLIAAADPRRSCSSRVSIRRCSELIAKSTVRVGAPIKWRGGEYGWISSWQHPTCLRVPDVSRADLATQIHGLNDLSVSDRASLLDELLSKNAVQLDTIDPNDPSFSKRDETTPPARLPTPKALTRPLLSFQQEGLAWMVSNEAGVVKGGILADEMGMGKTIQTIAMLLHQKGVRTQEVLARANKGKANSRQESRGAPTLVVVPTSALVQWEDEIRDCVVPGSLDVVVYYSDRKNIDAAALNDADVVLTTYPVVEGEWRKCVNRAMVQCRWCAKKLLPRSLVTHQKYFCGPDAVRTAKLAKREKKQDAANEKAMRTLRIKKGDAADVVDVVEANGTDGKGTEKKRKALPTPGNFYRELMTKAGRPAMSMYDGAIKARRNPGGGATGTQKESQKEPKDEDGINSDSYSDGIEIVGETPAAKSTADAADDERLRVVMQVSLREAETRNAANAGSAKRATRGRGAQPAGTSSKGKGVATAKNPPARRARGKPSAPKKQKKNDSDDEDEWLPSNDGDSTQNDVDAQLAFALAMEDAERDLVKLEPAAAKSKQGTLCLPVGSSFDSAKIHQLVSDPVDLSDSLLHSIEWGRIVLDEAHKIKARTTNTAKCIYDLRSDKKWCLSGTPLQNRVGELYSLVRFLRMDPHAYYFCKVKGCECKSLSWNFGPEQRACSECGHAGPRHYSHFNQTVINPINRYGYVGDGRKGFESLRDDILKPAQLRRTKAERSGDVKLPSLTINVEKTHMDEVEKDFYESLYMLTRAKFDGYVAKGSVLHNYAHIFELLSRLRQTCDHPYLVVHSKYGTTRVAGEDAEAKAETRMTSEKTTGKRRRTEETPTPVNPTPTPLADETFQPTAGAADAKFYCGMCADEVDVDDAALTACKHVFHRECITQYASSAPAGGKVTCPACRVNLTVDLQPGDLSAAKRISAADVTAKKKQKNDLIPSKSILSRIDLSKYTSSTKVEALMGGLRSMRDEDLRNAKGDANKNEMSDAKTPKPQILPNKAIVFSQYTSMIEIVEWRLRKEGFTIAKLLGSMPVSQRAANLRAFREDPAVTIILMSLKSGGEGLNLQTANRVFVLEPWWNPAVEMQAVMRAHRIGQQRPVVATRFCTKDTIEERMFELQEKKRLVFEGCMDGNQAALAQLTEEDLQFLFKR